MKATSCSKKNSKSEQAENRKKRLGQKLRDNLKRRKAQSRARKNTEDTLSKE